MFQIYRNGFWYRAFHWPGGGYLSVYRNSGNFFTKDTISEPLFTPRPSKKILEIAGNLIDIPEKEWNDLDHNFILLFDVFGCGGEIFIKILKIWI